MERKANRCSGRVKKLGSASALCKDSEGRHDSSATEGRLPCHIVHFIVPLRTRLMMLSTTIRLSAKQSKPL